MPKPTDLLTTGEAAGILGVSRERVLQLIEEGRLQAAVRDSTGRRLLRRSVVERLRADRERAKARERRTGG